MIFEIERALKYEQAINMFVARIADSKVRPLTRPEWEAIKIVEGWLRRFRDATTKMSASKTMTLSMVHAIFKTLQDHVRSALKDLPIWVPPSLKTGLLEAHTKLSDYYYKFDESPFYVWSSCK